MSSAEKVKKWIMPPAKPAEAGAEAGADKADENTTVVVKYVDRIEYKEIGNWVCMYCVHVPLCVRCMFLCINVLLHRVYMTACGVVSLTLAYWQRSLFFSFEFPWPVSQSPSLHLSHSYCFPCAFLPCTGYLSLSFLAVSLALITHTQLYRLKRSSTRKCQ